MRTFAAYLRKEIRDGRTMLIGIPAAIAVAIALAVFFVPVKILRDPVFPHVTALGAFALAVLAIATDLLPGEARRGKMGFLSRLPSGLGAAYGAKVAYLIGVTFLMAIVGYALGGLGGVLSGGEFAWPEIDLRLQVWRGTDPGSGILVIAAVVAVAGWTLAVSSWLPRSVLATPTTALVLAGFALPLFLLHVSAPGLEIGKDAMIVVVAALCIWPFGMGWISFARGRRFGRGPWSAAWRGLVATALLFVPAWGVAAVEAHDWNCVDPADERCSLESGYLGEGGRLVFLNARMERGPGATLHTIVVDLEDGSWRQVGGANEELRPVGMSWTPMRLRARSRLLRVIERGSLARPDLGATYHDGMTGMVLAPTSPALREAMRTDAPRVPEGRRVWSQAGLGYRLFGGDLFDPFRDRVHSGKELRDRGIVGRILIRPGRWLARMKIGGAYRYVLFDPESGETAPVKGTNLQWVAWLLDDGRVVTSDPKTRATIALDPETGARQGIELDAPVSFLVGRTPGKGYLVAYYDDRDGVRRLTHARLDAETLEVAMFPALESDGDMRFTLIAVPDEDTLIGIWDSCRIVRVRAGGEEREVLFPR